MNKCSKLEVFGNIIDEWFVLLSKLGVDYIFFGVLIKYV